ncbi:VOC family protein [Streptomyces sp. CA-210063]|uniref:VOC family protein n=1 Tax=Streptomyces sp. CA-210063 TaxID=2801029 RepID=UPI00214B91FD|nr:VOC family protein [Streptomyces sp. CA-210063]UUU34094.1 VOC family protein [Streptomyces sp. CA-210063]
MPVAPGIGHIALTVSDVKRSAEFYNRLLDTQTVLDVEDEYGPFVANASPSFILGFRKHEATNEADVFDPARVGLDHCGFHVADRGQLEVWEARLDEQGVSHSGIVEDPFGLHLSFKDPDNIALEFFCPAGQG